MIEYDPEQQGQEIPEGDLGVKVIGVGGAGANVLDRMALEGSDEAELLTMNTDMRALNTSVSSGKIQLGATLLKGMGAGGDPELGKQAALEAVDEIRAAIRGAKMIFVCVGLGGGTGSGAAPEVCRIAKEEGVFLSVFATLPFSFEGERRMEQALAALERIGQYANTVMTFENDRMGELIVPKEGVAQAFAAADKIISQSIRATVNVVHRPGIIRIGMDDLLTALKDKNSRCLFGFGQAKGEARAHEAVEQALNCPLLDKGKLLNDASSVLVQVAGGESMTLFEVQAVMDEINKHVGDGTQILFGTGSDPRLGNSLSVTVISSLAGEAPAAAQAEPATATVTVDPLQQVTAQPTSTLAAAVTAAAKPAPTLVAEPEPAPVFEEVAEPAPAPEPEPVKEEKAPEPEPEPEPVAEEPEPEPEPEPVAEEPEPEPEPEPVAEEPEPEEEEVVVPEPVAAKKIVIEEEPATNPIAAAVSAGTPALVSDEEEVTPLSSADKVEATTEDEETITLSRIVSEGKTGKILTREVPEVPEPGPVEPTKAPAVKMADSPTSEKAQQQQEMLQLDPVAAKGRFAKTDPTIVDGEDLDVPTFLRKKG